ncbi:hypothetical protein JTB14_028608 [Gonioctena quinquepunctata]|nr:hypothetical protein JTB14_028608 [Gonioctena quinquepunctata]
MKIFHAISCFLFLLVAIPFGDSTGAIIEEPPSYELKIVPTNFKNARSILGYDNFQKLSPNGTKKYAWEM